MAHRPKGTRVPFSVVCMGLRLAPPLIPTYKSPSSYEDHKGMNLFTSFQGPPPTPTFRWTIHNVHVFETEKQKMCGDDTYKFGMELFLDVEKERYGNFTTKRPIAWD